MEKKKHGLDPENEGLEVESFQMKLQETAGKTQSWSEE